MYGHAAYFHLGRLRLGQEGGTAASSSESANLKVKMFCMAEATLEKEWT